MQEVVRCYAGYRIKQRASRRLPKGRLIIYISAMIAVLYRWLTSTFVWILIILDQFPVSIVYS